MTMARIAWLLAVLSAWLALASAFDAPTFCKCSCFSNSTIIPLGPQHPSNPAPPSSSSSPSSPPPPPPPPSQLRQLLHTRASSASCSQCNRAFCLDYNLPICKGAEEKDVVAMCFQRDSRKDQIIVWAFLLGTGSLLGWTALQHVLALRAARAAASSRAPLLGGSGGGGGRQSPRSPAADGQRGQYAPLDGRGET